MGFGCSKRCYRAPGAAFLSLKLLFIKSYQTSGCSGGRCQHGRARPLITNSYRPSRGMHRCSGRRADRLLCPALPWGCSSGQEQRAAAALSRRQEKQPIAWEKQEKQPLAWERQGKQPLAWERQEKQPLAWESRELGPFSPAAALLSHNYGQGSLYSAPC